MCSFCIIRTGGVACQTPETRVLYLIFRGKRGRMESLPSTQSSTSSTSATHPSRRGLVLLVVVLAASSLLGGLFGSPHARASSTNDVQDSMKQFSSVLAVVERNYADPVDVDKVIYDGAIPGMLQDRKSTRLNS